MAEMTKNGFTEFRYIRDNKSPKGGVILYFDVDKEHKTFTMSYAICSKQDHFNRRIGRIKAKGLYKRRSNIIGEMAYNHTVPLVENAEAHISNALRKMDLEKNHRADFLTILDYYEHHRDMV